MESKGWLKKQAGKKKAGIENQFQPLNLFFNQFIERPAVISGRIVLI